MVKTPSELGALIERYRRQVEQFGIRCERILLFGSYADGAVRNESDIDLIVVSSDWVTYCERERLEILGIAAARILEPVQAQGFTPDEIANQQLTAFWRHIVSEKAVPPSNVTATVIR